MRPPRIASFLAAAALLSPAVDGQPGSDRELRDAWERLSAEERAETAEWFRAECEALETLQAKHVRFALALSSEEPGLWSTPTEAPFYDPEVHAPGLVIARKRLAPTSKKARAAREKFLPVPRANALRSGFGYDWASGKPLRLAEEPDPTVVFENALLGAAPASAPARTIPRHLLDDAAARAGFAAFGHAYTNRKGQVYAGITLYDAWRSGKPMEMPDVDNLGLVHELQDEWERWVSPVAARDQESLYEEVATLYAPLPRYRELRETLADLFLAADPAPVGTHAPAHTALHAVWIEAELDPDRLAVSLPPAAEVDEWLRARMRARTTEPELWRQAEERQARLRKDALVLRRVLTGILRQMGAFDE